MTRCAPLSESMPCKNRRNGTEIKPLPPRSPPECSAAACSRSNGNRQNSGIKVNAPLRQESSLIVQVQKPTVPQIDFEKKQHVQVNFYVGDVRSCSDSNAMVDYIISQFQ